MKLTYLTICFLLFGFALQAQTPQPYYKNGVVVCAQPEAAKVGVAILKKGGNAVDAAVAVQFALAVVYPVAGNIGGGGFMVYRSGKGKTATLDFREKAPKMASRDMYLDSAGNPITKMSIYGHMAVGVPGSVAGMVKAHARYGKLSWRKVVQPALDLAAKGYVLSARQAAEFNRNKATLLKYNPLGTALVKDIAWKEGDTLIQPERARTLKRIRDFMVDNPESWKHATRRKAFAAQFALTGDSLVRPPKGYRADHVLVEDLKRKDIVASSPLTDEELLSEADRIASATRRAITERMEEDPAFYRQFSEMLEETIQAYREKRSAPAASTSRCLSWNALKRIGSARALETTPRSSTTTRDCSSSISFSSCLLP